MNIYENIIILNASLSDEEINTSTSRIKDIIIKSGGEVLKTDVWGRKKLGYEIKNFSPFREIAPECFDVFIVNKFSFIRAESAKLSSLKSLLVSCHDTSSYLSMY